MHTLQATIPEAGGVLTGAELRPPVMMLEGAHTGVVRSVQVRGWGCYSALMQCRVASVLRVYFASVQFELVWVWVWVWVWVRTICCDMI
jgi:hypothetical protein